MKFSLCGKQAKEYGIELNMATLWAQAPWILLLADECQFGQAACRRKPEAYRNFEAVRDLATVMQNDTEWSRRLIVILVKYTGLVNPRVDTSPLWNPEAEAAHYERLH